MPTFDLSPTSDTVGSANFVKTGAGTNFGCLKLPDDALSTYLTSNGPDGDTIRCGMEDVSLYVVPIAVNVRARWKKSTNTNPGRIALGIYLGGNFSMDSEQDPTITFADRSVSLSRPGGGSWTASDVNSAELVLRTFDPDGSDDEDVQTTTLCAAVESGLAPGAFAALMLQWLGPLVAVGLHELPKIAGAIRARSRGRVRFHRAELEPAWRELREYRYPRSWFRPALA